MNAAGREGRQREQRILVLLSVGMDRGATTMELAQFLYGRHYTANQSARVLAACRRLEGKGKLTSERSFRYDRQDGIVGNQGLFGGAGVCKRTFLVWTKVAR